MKIYKIESVATHINRVTGKVVPDEMVTFTPAYELVAQDGKSVYLADGFSYRDDVPVVGRYAKETHRFFDPDNNEIEFETWK